MRREFHVRFSEGPGVRFPRATHLVVLVDTHPHHRWLRTAVIKRLREELAKLDVEVNEEKTKVVDLEQGKSFGFVGFQFQWIRGRLGRMMVFNPPQMKKRTALLRRLKPIFRRFESQPTQKLVEHINPILRGWVNYFAIGNSSRCFSFVRDWVEKKIRRHLARARKRSGFGWKRWSRDLIYNEFGLHSDYRVRWISKTRPAR